ncbi:hypothetical protein HNQ88_003588 [Aureibacter tunicatorum]|uniref:Uncharacterized protein n=1 Tax=Aureibacter tunicatorum TaxID=866807 RepID=A0AAE3XP36_9BACT|nr:hypothetical protein [Aureibacter tunicatorum]BDD06625.1 hypothetical protein AUTU_41080 [Aureibacter tunicatorum]
MSCLNFPQLRSKKPFYKKEHDEPRKSENERPQKVDEIFKKNLKDKINSRQKSFQHVC